MDRPIEVEARRADAARALTRHLERDDQGGPEAIVVLSRNQADVIAALLEQFAIDDGATQMAKVALEMAVLIEKQIGS